MGVIIDGASLAKKIRESVLIASRQFEGTYDRRPGLGVILVGNNQASLRYVNAKSADCVECGIHSMTVMLPETASESLLLKTIKSMNYNDDIDGILVQMPLPFGFDENRVKAAIDPRKDVDCFTCENAGRLWTHNCEILKPCTPAGVMDMLDFTVGLEWCAGKSAVVIGRSNIVGRPMAEMLLACDMTVTVCHSKTADFRKYTRSADLIVSAAGVPGLLTADCIKSGAVVIDVSMNRDADGKLCGDCDDTVGAKAGYITPVPGGVGPMTRAELMHNVLIAATAREKYK